MLPQPYPRYCPAHICLQCLQTDDCIECTPGRHGQCTACDYGLGLDASGKCVPCRQQGCEFCSKDADSCDQCLYSLPLFFNATSRECISCADPNCGKGQIKGWHSASRGGDCWHWLTARSASILPTWQNPCKPLPMHIFHVQLCATFHRTSVTSALSMMRTLIPLRPPVSHAKWTVA
jgi:hypothetical protein